MTPKILFFDEATSSLDNSIQDLISKSLESIKVTRVVVTHGLSSVLSCEKIFMMYIGYGAKIVEEGTFIIIEDAGYPRQDGKIPWSFTVT